MKEQIIKEIVCKHFFIEPEMLYLKTRKMHIVYPKQVIIWLLRDVLEYTFQKCAEVFSSTHSNAIHSYNSVKNLIDTDRNYREKVITIKQEVEMELFLEKIDLLKICIENTKIYS